MAMPSVAPCRHFRHYVATQLGLRRHVVPAASGRNLGYVGTQFGGHRQANEGEKSQKVNWSTVTFSKMSHFSGREKGRDLGEDILTLLIISI